MTKGPTGALSLALHLRVRPDRAEIAADQLWGLGATAIEERGDKRGTTILVAGFVDDVTTRAAATALGADATVQTIDAAVWDAWRDHASPAAAGGQLLVVPAWIDPPSTDRTVLLLDPGPVFGSGAHASTQLVLEAFDQIDLDWRTLLDVGCGSGVLSIAAALLGARQAVGIDIDPEAVAITNENAERNGVGDRVEVSTTLLADVTGRFDVVAANILRPALLDMAPDLAARVGEGGHLVLSGLLTDQADAVVAAVTAADGSLTEVDRLHSDGWAAPVITQL
ncbi:MAG: 50S ribosomal protein L11 methyltransferase [Actinomycetia bacterium]|nr:50S ribosomal protein L11 methyltransferase [Actinomycetes bacterium]